MELRNRQQLVRLYTIFMIARSQWLYAIFMIAGSQWEDRAAVTVMVACDWLREEEMSRSMSLQENGK